MNKQVVFLTIFSIIWIAAGSTYVGNLACSAVNNLMPLELSDGAKTFQSKGHFSFGLSSAELKTDKEITPFFKAIADYLNQDPQKQLKLSGQFLSEELNLSTFESLGTARAEAIKQSLLAYGAPAQQIIVSEKILDENTMINNVLYDGVGLELITSTTTLTDSTVTTETSTPEFEQTNEKAPKANEFVEPLTLYGDAVFSMDLNPSMQHYIDKISAYLTEHPKAVLQITGHTQELGSIVKNADRSLELARKARRFFKGNGINYRRIKTNAKGATEPMLTPDFPEAHSKNNRVEIKIVKD